MEPVGEFYSKDKAVETLEKGEVAIFSAGTGNPYFTTDTGSSLRGIEIEADVMLKGTRVDRITSYNVCYTKLLRNRDIDNDQFLKLVKEGLLTATSNFTRNNFV